MSSEHRPRAPGAARELDAPARRAIVDALGRRQVTADEVDPGGMTAAQLAELVGLHPTTVRFHAERLEAAGLIESRLTTAFGVGRPRKVYSLPGPADEASRVTFLLRLLELMTDSFGRGDTPEQAGERWTRDHHLSLAPTPPVSTPGEWVGRIGVVVDLLREWGYGAELTTRDGGRTCLILLTECPFVDLARRNPDVVCGIHRGLLRGVLEQLGEQDSEISVTPFVEPNLCHASVRTPRPLASRVVGPPPQGAPG